MAGDGWAAGGGRRRGIFVGFLLGWLALASGVAQSAPGAAVRRPASAGGVAPTGLVGNSCLIWPFENRSGDSSLDWMGESFVVALQQSLRGSGVTVLSRRQRLAALKLAGAPDGVVLSHATELRIADEAGARWMVSGWYRYDGESLRMGAWVFDLKREHMVRVTEPAGLLDGLQSLQAGLGAAVRARVAPGSAAALDPAPLPLPAYESYVRAQLAQSPAERLRELEIAIHLAPDDARVIYALGDAELAAGDNAAAARWLARVPAGSPDADRAGFGLGIAAYRMGDYRRAAQAFQALLAKLPLPAVSADLALAENLRQHPGAVPPKLNMDFPVGSFKQLARTVAQFNAAQLHRLAPADRVAAELQAGQKLQAQGGWDAAAQQYQRVIAAAASVPAQLAAAHAGMAAVWVERHDPQRARAEVRAALAADPGNAQATQLQQRLSDPAPARPVSPSRQ